MSTFAASVEFTCDFGTQEILIRNYQHSAVVPAHSLNWFATANFTSYNVKRSLTSGGPYTTVAAGVSATPYIDSGLTNGTMYYYVVSGMNGST